MKLIKIFFLFQFFILSLLANVNLYLNEKVILGEPLVFTIEISGEKVKFPDLSLIDGNVVQEISSSISTNIINGTVSKVIKKSYSLISTKDFIFPSLEFEIDGEKFKTKEKNIVVEKVSKTKSDIFDLSINVDKNEFYVGENFILKILFKHKKDAKIVGLSLNKPTFDGFWYKQIDDTKKYEENDFNIIELKFLLTPLKDGILTINPILLQAQIIDESFKSYFSTTKDINIYSNELNLKIKKLPQDIKLVGDFEIESTIDKEKIKAGEAVSYKLKITGNGNFDDILDIKLPLSDVTIYENKPEIKTYISNDKYEGTYEKVFSIVSNKSFIIPSITFEYFDKNEEKVVTKTTKTYEIKVEEKEVKESFLEKADKNVETKEVVKIVEKSSLEDKILYFVLGIVFSLLIVSLYFYVITSKRKNKDEIYPLLKRVKESKSKKELIKILAIYLKIDSRLDELIFRLEKEEDFKLLKKEIINILKELKL